MLIVLLFHFHFHAVVVVVFQLLNSAYLFKPYYPVGALVTHFTLFVKCKLLSSSLKQKSVRQCRPERERIVRYYVVSARFLRSFLSM